MTMTNSIPDRNVEIAIARAYYEDEVGKSKYPDSTLPWDDLPINVRVSRANIINSLIIQGVILPGFKVMP
jgi:hypothetical protein